MKRAEIRLIRERIEMYERFEAEERSEGQKATDREEKQYHLEQEKLNGCAANTLRQILEALGVSVKSE